MTPKLGLIRVIFTPKKESFCTFLFHSTFGVKLDLMIKAVLWSRLAMMRDNISYTHTQVLWEKGFRGDTLLVLVAKYGQKRHPKDSCYIILDCSLDCYISKEIAMQLYTQFFPLSAHPTER